ncbi:MAG: large subunit ribosomal protein L18 [Flavobacteriales bacterium]|jgi:large subunit ribosomal protein L18
MKLTKKDRRARIKSRIRKVVQGTTDQPRLSVFRSNKEIYAQIIDDSTGRTVCSASSLKNKEASKGNRMEQASFVGKMLGEKAKSAGIQKVKFDRNGFLYHGRIKTLADAVRETGINF